MPDYVTSLNSASYVTQQVAITSVDVVNRQAAGLTRQGTTIYINTGHYVGGMQVTPSIGDQWYVQKVGGEWRLENRIPFNDPNLSTIATQGQVQVGSGKGPVELNGPQVNVNGDLAIPAVTGLLKSGDTVTAATPDVDYATPATTAANLTSALTTKTTTTMPYHGAQVAFVATSETTTSTTYTDLTTPGPAVTVTPGASGMVMVLLYGQFGASNVGNIPFMSFAASGGNTQAASDGMALSVQIASGAGLGASAGATFLLTGLNSVSTTFTAKYRVTANTGNFSNRRITVIPL